MAVPLPLPLPLPKCETVSLIFFPSSIAILGVGAPTLSFFQAKVKAPPVMTRRMTSTMRKPSHRLPAPLTKIPSNTQASVSRKKITAKTPNTAPAATAAAPRARLEAFWIISVLASSISSWTSRVRRSETSVSAAAKFSFAEPFLAAPFLADPFLVDLAVLGGKSLHHLGEEEAADEGGGDEVFGMVRRQRHGLLGRVRIRRLSGERRGRLRL